MNSNNASRVIKYFAQFRTSTFCLALLFCGYCGALSSEKIDVSGVSFTEKQRRVADQIVSVFENNTPVIQYQYSETLGDGRGITAGRAGFTSATGDMYLVVSEYTKRAPGNALEKYLPRLRYLAKKYSGSTRKLSGLNEAWHSASTDSRFRQVQDEVVNQLYYNNAVTHTRDIPATHALSLLILYDTIIQHGDGTDPDGLPALIRRTRKILKGADVTEKQWNTEFLKQRRLTLSHASSRSTRKVWAESVGRVDTLQALVDSENNHLHKRIDINTWGTAFSIKAE